MPATSRHRHPQGYEIVFDEEPHVYYTILTGHLTPTGTVPRANMNPDGSYGNKTVANKIFYTSGTTFVHKFCPPFDPDGKIAEKKAREVGVSPDQIRFEWKQKGIAACEMGTRVHETCEDILHRRAFRNQPKDDHERKLMAAGWEACQRIMADYNVIGVEQMVGDLDCQIAGTIDLLVSNKKTGAVGIFDWKTNAKIDFQNNFRNGSRMLRPIQHLHNCSGVIYTLQLNLYQYILVKSGYLPRDTKFERQIIQLTEDGPKFFPLPDLQIEVRDMLVFVLEQPPF